MFDFILQNIEKMKQDFEIKRVIIGLSALTLSSKSASLDPSIQQRFPDFMKAILFLCQKSLEMRAKKLAKEDECEEDKDCE